MDFTQQVLACWARDTPGKAQLKILHLAGLWKKGGSELEKGRGTVPRCGWAKMCGLC